MRILLSGQLERHERLSWCSIARFFCFPLEGDMARTVYRSVRLDAKTDLALREMADSQTQGNISFLLRSLVLDAAKKQGLLPETPKPFRRAAAVPTCEGARS
jgi:hypothetical protein